MSMGINNSVIVVIIRMKYDINYGISKKSSDIPHQSSVCPQNSPIDCNGVQLKISITLFLVLRPLYRRSGDVHAYNINYENSIYIRCKRDWRCKSMMATLGVCRIEIRARITRTTFETPKYPRRPRDQYTAQIVNTLELSAPHHNWGKKNLSNLVISLVKLQTTNTCICSSKKMVALWNSRIVKHSRDL